MVLYYAIAILAPFVNHDQIFYMKNYISQVKEELYNKEVENPVNLTIFMKQYLLYKHYISSCTPSKS